MTSFNPPVPRMGRNAAIVAGVLLLHVVLLWALQTGLLRRAVEIVIPAEVISEIIEPPVPKVEPPPPPATVPPQPQPRTASPSQPPAPMPVVISDPAPAPNAPTGVVMPQPAPPPVRTPVAVAPSAAPAPAVPPKVELPSSDADYLQNPKPAYPAISKRLGEQGKVLVGVLIGVNGQAQKAELRQSSGFERLDQIALATVLKWRFVPGKRGGVPEAMWFNVPINFVLE